LCPHGHRAVAAALARNVALLITHGRQQDLD